MAKPIVSKKLSLNAVPTFKAVVSIPVPGDGFTDVEFTFKYRTKDQFKEFGESLKGCEDIDLLMDIACGWDLDDPFDATSLEKMLQLYMGAAPAVLQAYVAEVTGARTKNL
jgi:hypothetical protein